MFDAWETAENRCSPRDVRRGVVVCCTVFYCALAWLGKAPPRAAEPREVVTNSLGMKLVAIEAGAFWMGSPLGEPGRRLEERRHRVVLTAPFYLGAYEVTQQQYARVMVADPSEFRVGGAQAERVTGEKTGRFPVDSVNWHAAVAFCRRLTAVPAEQAARRSYRLPSEAEWEYAARAGTDGIWFFGRRSDRLTRHAWYRRSSGRRTHAVGQKLPNSWGLFDMYGNVWEWCRDWHSADYYPRSPRQDPVGPSTGDARVLRGGGWASGAARCRSAARLRDPPAVGDPDTGFRVVMVVSERESAPGADTSRDEPTGSAALSSGRSRRP